MLQNIYFSHASQKDSVNANVQDDKISILSKELEKIVQYWMASSNKRILKYKELNNRYDDPKLYAREIDIIKFNNKNILFGEIKCSCNKLTLNKAIAQLSKTKRIIDGGLGAEFKSEFIIIYFNLDYSSTEIGDVQTFNQDYRKTLPQTKYHPSLGEYKLLVLNPKDVFEFGCVRNIIQQPNILNEAINEAFMRVNVRKANQKYNLIVNRNHFKTNYNQAA